MAKSVGQGHKRWDKAVSSGYEHIRRLTHELLLPAVERCAVIASRLRGLSKYQHSARVLGLSCRDLDYVLDAISCLTVLAHGILDCAGTEFRQFMTFSGWLRREIETQAADPTSATDPAERDTDFDYGKVLTYMQGPMMQSKLNRLLQDTPSNAEAAKSLSGDATSLHHSFKANLAKLKTGLPVEGGPISLWELTSLLERRCDIVFQQIAEAQKRNVVLGTPLALTSSEDGVIADMKMISEVYEP